MKEQNGDVGRGSMKSKNEEREEGSAGRGKDNEKGRREKGEKEGKKDRLFAALSQKM